MSILYNRSPLTILAISKSMKSYTLYGQWPQVCIYRNYGRQYIYSYYYVNQFYYSFSQFEPMVTQKMIWSEELKEKREISRKQDLSLKGLYEKKYLANKYFFNTIFIKTVCIIERYIIISTCSWIAWSFF